MLSSRVVKGVWQVKEGLALDYLITDSSSPGVDDLWVDWKQVLLLLEDSKPKFSQIWTLKAISYCPFLDVLRAAIENTGLVKDLLNSLVQPLLGKEHLEAVDYQDEESDVWQAEKDTSQEDETQRIILDELEIRETEKQDPHLVGKGGDNEKRSVQGKRKEQSQLSCTICSKQLSGRARLYSHYMSKHPDSPSLHPPPPPGTLPGLDSTREKHGEPAERNTCQCCSRTFATSIWLYKHCIADHPDREDIRPEPPVKVKGLRLAHLHEREQLLCGLPGCALLFSHFKVGDNSSVSTSRREGSRFSKETF